MNPSASAAHRASTHGTSAEELSTRGSALAPFCMNALNSNQRWLGMAGGALLAGWGLSRRSLGGLAVALGGGYLSYCASTGRWQVPEWLKSTAGQWQLTGPAQRLQQALAARPSEPQTGTEPDVHQWYPPIDADKVEEASMDSFPASDPPSFMNSTASPSDRPGHRPVQ